MKIEEEISIPPATIIRSAASSKASVEKDLKNQKPRIKPIKEANTFIPLIATMMIEACRRGKAIFVRSHIRDVHSKSTKSLSNKPICQGKEGGQRA